MSRFHKQKLSHKVEKSRVTKPHLVYQKFELKNPLLVGKKAESEYILLIRDKEQQIEVKIHLSPENYRQFLETMTEDQ
jgi:hypothetical protein